MKAITRFLSIEKASEGMVLAKDVGGEAGSALMAGGTILTRQLIESLKRKRVRSICVIVSGERDFPEDEIKAMEEALKEEVLSRFRKDPDGPVMRGLFMAVLRIEAMRRLVHEQKC